MTRIRIVAAAAAALLVLAGCGNGSDDGGGARSCKDVVANAAEATNMPDRRERLRPAFDACDSIAEFASAVAQYPKALEDVDVEAYVRRQCREVGALRDARLCEAFG